MKSIISNLISTDHRDTAYLTGMRAYAALAVVLIHTGGFFQSWSSFADRVVDSGKYGVQVFYALSAVTICLSILSAGDRFTLGVYFRRRFLRIFPLYGFLLILLLVVGYESYWGEVFDVPHDLKSLIYHLTLFNIFDPRYANNAIAVEWSIPIEFTYYLLLPAMVWLCRRGMAGIFAFLLLSYLIAASASLMPNTLPDPHKAIAPAWQFQRYMPIYVVSILFVFAFLKYRNIVAAVSGNVFLIACIFLLLIQLIWMPVEDGDFYPILTLAIIAGCTTDSFLRRWILESRPVIWLGNISFSIYLVHHPFKSFFNQLGLQDVLPEIVNWLLMMVALIAVSTTTYLLIERPFLKSDFALKWRFARR